MTDNDSPGSRDDAPDFRPRRETPIGMIVAIGLVVLVAAFFGWRWYQQQQKPPEPAPVATAPNDGPAPAPAAEPTGPQNPVDALAPPDAALPALAESDSRVMKALAELLGGKHASEYLRSDGIVRRFVATVDNLAREQAPASAWPVQPTAQRFITDGPQGGTQTIAANNAARYNGIVLLAETVDPAKAATVYAKLYPLFQKAYEELGFPGRYFNDRLIAVIDHLLQAPEPSGPVQVRLVEVKGDVPSTRPWVRYEYVDPKLEAMSSGQKIMVRMGPENERKVKASLRGFRQQIATGELAKKKQP
ncbi:hypothetical protein J2W28_003229 [Variovorax boronicumulans]|uniref:DUF3014 domain-containing protein n=1 Tax=Variovorax boronicumulans TaxID=436515 RepID=UPI0027803FEA|nr:DUF3014 domain-containing protein [Variovorax boronicumulans]MDP9992831.1 hypothetical protein [Variovorax boronicumulans]MDQ0004078.1 hypothetical protein [Variovorax boronicumulans]